MIMDAVMNIENAISFQPEQAMISLNEMKALLYISMPGSTRHAADQAVPEQEAEKLAVTNWQKHQVNIIA